MSDPVSELLELLELTYGPAELATARRIQFLQKHGWNHRSEQEPGVFGKITEHWWVKGEAKEFASRAVQMQAREILERIRGEVAG